ncbi:MAG: hypothetical protein GQ477_02835 [Nanohaloarchaea archaeon]|nr:hypothetical protein [Candidatus Nanohaloarchaea archaeon]
MFDQFLFMDYIRIIVLIIFSVRITITDFKFKKIYNNDLLRMSTVGFILFLVGFNFDLLPSLVTNFILALGFGIIFWKIGIWSAGDGKLFAVCSMYLPYKMYLPFFSSQVIVLNVFILAFLFWLVPMIFKTKRHEKIDSFRLSFSPKNIINMFLVLFGVFYFIWRGIYLLGVGLYSGSFLISLAIAIIAFTVLQKMFSSKVTYILLILAILRPFFDPYFASFETLITLGLTVFGLLFAGALGNLSMYISYSEKRLSDICVGDIPIGVMIKGQNKIAEIGFFIENKLGNKDKILKFGFNETDIFKAKKIKNLDGFIIKKTISFAPLFFVATFITIFIGTDVLLYLASLVYDGWFYD